MNELLALLPQDLYQRWQQQLELVQMPQGHVLFEPGRTLKYVVFPSSALVSLLYVNENGSSSEIAIVGREGLVGVSSIMGGTTAPMRAVVQCAGDGYRLDADLIKQEFERSSAAAHLMLRYTQALLTQMAQTAVCNSRHSLSQQLCRWLLRSLDRLNGDELAMTHGLIAANLGVRRESVTLAAHRLQEAGVIRYTRGHIKVLDRPALEARSCECYAVVKKEYARLMRPCLAIQRGH